MSQYYASVTQNENDISENMCIMWHQVVTFCTSSIVIHPNETSLLSTQHLVHIALISFFFFLLVYILAVCLFILFIPTAYKF